MNNWQQTRQQFIKSLATSGRYSAHTITHYQYGTDWLLHWLAVTKAPFLEIDVDEYNAWLASGNISRSTHRQLLTALRQFIKWLRKTGHEVKCHEDNVVLPRINRAKGIKHLSLKEVEDMIKLSDSSRDRAVIYLLFSTGMRISELLSLTVGQFSFADGSVLPPVEIVITGKGNKTRTVYISKRACRLLEDWIKSERVSPDSGEIIPDDRLFKISTRTIETRIKDIGDRALDKNVTPHMLRHSFATYMLAKGVDLRVVQEMLGHADIGTTTVYAAVTNKMLKDKHEEMMA